MSLDVVNKVAAGILGAAILAILASCSAATSGTPAAGVTADASAIHSYIVEADSTDKAATAVTAAGGKVISRLGVIDAVEANLTEAQHAKVLETVSVRQVTPNAPITTQAAASVRDDRLVRSRQRPAHPAAGRHHLPPRSHAVELAQRHAEVQVAAQ